MCLPQNGATTLGWDIEGSCGRTAPELGLMRKGEKLGQPRGNSDPEPKSRAPDRRNSKGLRDLQMTRHPEEPQIPVQTGI